MHYPQRLDQQRRNPRTLSGRARAPGLALVVLLALGTLLGLFHNRWRRAGQPDPVLATIRFVFFPFQQGAAQTEAALERVGSWFRPQQIADENARLRAEVARLRIENQYLEAGASAASRLRNRLGFAQRNRQRLLAAEVIGLRSSPLVDTITIARGTRDRVALGATVRAPEGLIGQVSDVSLLSAQVTLLSDANSGVGAMVLRNNRIQGVGILQGGGRGRPLELVYLKREDDVRTGDRVVSSGYGGVIPPDIPIGRVVSVAADEAQFLKGVRVAPDVTGRHTREVFVLPQTAPSTNPIP